MADVPTTPPDNTSTPDASANGAPLASIAVEAIYVDGVIKPLVPLDLPPGTPITLQIATRVTAVVVPRAELPTTDILTTDDRRPTTDDRRPAVSEPMPIVTP